MNSTLTVNNNQVERINKFFLFIIVPMLGIIIPNISGIISNTQYNWWQLLLSYGYFIFVAYAVWKGNVLFFINIRTAYEKNGERYLRIIITYFAVNILYAGVLTLALSIGWFTFSKENSFDWRAISNTSILVVFCIILINTVYEIVFLRQEMQNSLLKVKMMEMAKMQAELAALKAQIDPHFIFNSLNTLSYLITHKPDTAKFYNETLAKVYRYILLYKDQDLVFLKEELEFISNYFYLIKIRHEDAVNMIIEIPDIKAEHYLLTPVSLQMLIENAIKHNHFSRKDPLLINIGVQSNFVTVKNKIRLKEYPIYSSGIGLNNLKERYHLITNKNILIHTENEEFIVKVPILKS